MEVMEALQDISCTGEAYLVIDNFQLLEGAIQEAVAALSRHQAEGLHVIFLTQQVRRQDMAFGEGRRVCFLHSDVFRFGALDIGRYFKLCNVPLAQQEAETLHQNTEGWVAAVHLQMLQVAQNGGFEEAEGIGSARPPGGLGTG